MWRKNIKLYCNVISYHIRKVWDRGVLMKTAIKAVFCMFTHHSVQNMWFCCVSGRGMLKKKCCIKRISVIFHLKRYEQKCTECFCFYFFMWWDTPWRQREHKGMWDVSKAEQETKEGKNGGHTSTFASLKALKWLLSFWKEGFSEVLVSSQNLTCNW